MSEYTEWRSWPVKCDIWWVKGEQKTRFNWDTIRGEVLPSVKIPEWIAND